MDVLIEKLHINDAENLFGFELENKSFFEEMVPTRGEDYYLFDVFKNRLESLLKEQDRGDSYFYLIKNTKGIILGRMNLVDIDHINKIGHVGYRVGKMHTGKGIANLALKQMLLATIEKKLTLKAKTTDNNIASQKVLEKNGFIHVHTANEAFEMNGQKLRFVYYMREFNPSN